MLAVLALIGLDIFWCFFLPEMVADGDFWFLASTPITLWLVVASLFAMYFAGRYAFQRLVLNPIRPQVEKH